MRNRALWILIAALVPFQFIHAGPLDTVLLGGVPDDFQGGADPSFPSAQAESLVTWPLQDFDQSYHINGGAQNTSTLHTFSGIPIPIVAATLRVHLKASEWSSGLETDNVSVLFVEPSDTILPPRYISEFFADAIGSWASKDTATITYDLSAFPLNGGGTVNLIPEINQHGFIDINIGDETATDFAELTVSKAPNCSPLASMHKISSTTGNLTGPLSDSDRFGNSMVAIGDLNDDGVVDLAVGATGDSDGEVSGGAVYVLFLDSTAAVIGEQKISATAGSLGVNLIFAEHFGNEIAALGDLDGDGVEDIAVGAPGNDPPILAGKGSVYICFLHSDGTVKATTKITDGEGGFTGSLQEGDEFGNGVACLGDIDGDSIPDLAVGAIRDGNAGSVYLLFLNTDGTVREHRRITTGTNGFVGPLTSGDFFGASVSRLGDLDGNGTVDLLVGSPFDNTAAHDAGAVWICYLDSTGLVIDEKRVASDETYFSGYLDPNDRWGSTVCYMGDMDQDGIVEIAVGSGEDTDGGPQHGAIYILSIDPDGTVLRTMKISDTVGCLPATLDDGDQFGSGCAAIGDIDGNGTGDLLVGAPHDDDGGLNRGAAYIMLLTSPPAVPTSVAGAGIDRRALRYLGPASPNPFNPTTRVRFSVPEDAGLVRLNVHDVRGRLVRELLQFPNMPAGSHEAVWRGRNDAGSAVASGVYFFRLEGDGFTETRKVVLVR